MKRLMIGGLAAGCAGVGLYLLFAKPQPRPDSLPELPAAVVVATPPAPPPAAVLAEVVAVADLDPLLDPQVKPAGGVPFDPEPVVAASVPAGTPDRIPPAVD